MGVGQRIGTRLGQPDCIIQLAIGQQSGVGGDRGTAKLQPQTTVEIEPQRLPVDLPAGFAMAAPLDPV